MATSATPDRDWLASSNSAPSQRSTAWVCREHHADPVMLRSASSGPRSSFTMRRQVSQRVIAELASANAHQAVEVDGPDLAVTDLPGTRVGGDHIDDLVDVTALDDDFELDLRDELDLVLVAAERLTLSALPPEALHLTHGHAEHAEAPQAFLHLFQLERLDDRGHQMCHWFLLSMMV